MKNQVIIYMKSGRNFICEVHQSKDVLFPMDDAIRSRESFIRIFPTDGSSLFINLNEVETIQVLKANSNASTHSAI